MDIFEFMDHCKMLIKANADGGNKVEALRILRILIQTLTEKAEEWEKLV
jgi:hypothetical protein